MILAGRILARPGGSGSCFDRRGVDGVDLLREFEDVTELSREPFDVRVGKLQTGELREPSHFVS